MRRPEPRRLSFALEQTTAQAAPATPLARVQAAWEEAVGEVFAREAAPVAEHGGTVTVSCSSAAWAQEVELGAPDLLGRLNEVLERSGAAAVKSLRARTGKPPGGGPGD